jgi:hypothetical protein
MRFLLVMFVATLVACSHSPANSNDPLSGSINGTTFEVLGSYAETRGGVLYVTLVNTAASCGAFPLPATSLLRLDITMPPPTQGIGSFSLGSSDASPRVSATWFTDAGGLLHQNSATIVAGTLEVRGMAGAVTGSLAIASSKAALFGVFAADVCR